MWPLLLFIFPVTCIPVDACEFYITHIAQRRRQRQFEGWSKVDGCFTEIRVHLESLRAVGTSRHIWIRHHIVFVTRWALVWRTHTARGNCRLKNNKLGTCASSFAGMVRGEIKMAPPSKSIFQPSQLLKENVPPARKFGELGFLERTYLDVCAVVFGRADGAKKAVRFDLPDILFSFQKCGMKDSCYELSASNTGRLEEYGQSAKHVWGVCIYQPKQESMLRRKTIFCGNSELASSGSVEGKQVLFHKGTSSESAIVLIWSTEHNLTAIKRSCSSNNIDLIWFVSVGLYRNVT